VSRAGKALGGMLAAAMMLSTVWVLTPGGSGTVLAEGVGRATWTPAESTTSANASRFLIDDDSITYRTEAIWDRGQAAGLAAYLDSGLRYTHEVNDRGGRLSATGYWATNLPDPAFDRDDDDGDRRWEEAEIIAGAQAPVPGQTYVTLVQFSRWHGKRSGGECSWAWDRRLGTTEVLSQLSRDMFGEWQAERYTLAYESLPYPRVGTRPDIPADSTRPRCADARPGAGQSGFVVTFARPLSWSELTGLVSVGSGMWTAFEAIGSSPHDELVWTCGGPVDDAHRLAPCRDMGVRPAGVTAAVGYFDGLAIGQLRDDPAVAATSDLRDSLTGLLFDVGGFGIERPGLTVNDRYWELSLAD
jgi:hypothetical protein